MNDFKTVSSRKISFISVMISKHDKKNKKTLAYKPFTSQNEYMKINNFSTISIIKITMYHL